jgi:hypothetical protein
MRIDEGQRGTRKNKGARRDRRDVLELKYPKPCGYGIWKIINFDSENFVSNGVSQPYNHTHWCAFENGMREGERRGRARKKRKEGEKRKEGGSKIWKNS